MSVIETTRDGGYGGAERSFQGHQNNDHQQFGPVGFQMIRSIDIKNFRCYRHLQIDNCARLNVIVGDNGVGKTALLESIFLPLASGTEVAFRLRQQRGLDGTFSGSVRRIEEAIWRDFFYRSDFSSPISLALSGDGIESRSLTISRVPADFLFPIGESAGESIASAPVSFVWRDSVGREYRLIPQIAAGQAIQMPDTGEDLPDFFHFAANQTVSSIETAGRFSDLSTRGQHQHFVDVFTREYPWVEEINIEVAAGAPALYAKVKGTKTKVPLANISGGINKCVSVMLAMASRKKSIVLVDEIENGIFYKHHTAIWRGLITFMRENQSQLFVTTHSQECLNALVMAAGEQVDDISLWRVERSDDGPSISQFTGEELQAGIEYGSEIRG